MFPKSGWKSFLLVKTTYSTTREYIERCVEKCVEKWIVFFCVVDIKLLGRRFLEACAIATIMTAKKLGISAYQYICDRVDSTFEMHLWLN
ncbi:MULTISPECIES: hypothetical protein [Methanosarcina]|uniref:Mobile element protein n=3 Tax=Methanosarcina barkeri TaxID=2208 RepID=A0A0E3QW83_METBA|nr:MULTISPECIES: hypothetical protein [Methanosarcina]AKB55903.1 hypothetical protein MSBRM_2905 [Methanosarcina barkeri MS]AKB59380.1 hypothetical protein MSBR2_2864 [Methanosarcina barkeri 227]AKJ40052.1 hypothetical protein MCM1_3061 [Methanosarcina barkeri CM1]OEC90550.1 hypothetical protein A9239_04470 [Methanosarcina sp. A14]